MTITNIGSINIDHVYRVEEFSLPGETRLVNEYSAGLGGKGANQSIASARAGSRVVHIGAVGSDGDWALNALRDAGVGIQGIKMVQASTGHAVIQVNRHGENCILVHPGANLVLTDNQVSQAIEDMQQGDWLLFQNETNLTREIAALGRTRAIKICYSAAPFIVDRVLPILSQIDLLVVNELEAASLAANLDCDQDSIPVPALLVTRGGKGARYLEHEGRGCVISAPAFEVDVIDTTGAGDTFLGYFLSSIDTGLDTMTALRRASAAAALQISRSGAAEAIPTAEAVSEFLAVNSTA